MEELFVAVEVRVHFVLLGLGLLETDDVRLQGRHERVEEPLALYGSDSVDVPRCDEHATWYQSRPETPSLRAAAPSNLAGVSEFSNESVVAIENTLNNVDRALERLRVGNYRTCQACGAEIDQAELLKNPLLANCRAHPELS